MIDSGEKSCAKKRKKKAEARNIYPFSGSQVQINQGGGEEGKSQTYQSQKCLGEWLTLSICLGGGGSRK